jgi:hypothetical protein
MFCQSERVNGQLELTLYGAALYERRHIGAAVEHTHYVQANGGTVATVHRTGTSTTNTTRYLHKDHLGLSGGDHQRVGHDRRVIGL